MATREYARNNLGFSEPHLASLLDTALGLVGTTTKATASLIQVTHANLTASHDAGVQAVLSGYVFDPEFGTLIERLNLKNVIPTLRAWGDDADAALLAWDAQTTAQRFAVLKVVLARFGTLCDRMADLLKVQGLE